MPISSVSVNGQNLAVNFSFADLEKKVDGSKNLGELKFGADGKLHRINNHAFFTSKNTVVTTADENRNTREVIMALLNDKFGQGTELQRNLLLEAEKILLGDDVVFRPISRDEVRQIIAELKNVNASEASMNTMTWGISSGAPRRTARRGGMRSTTVCSVARMRVVAPLR